jgi:UDP-N-acetylmuramoyl-L-alanyl-D-glutamate--2,6-diaminopimelate ligase
MARPRINSKTRSRQLGKEAGEMHSTQKRARGVSLRAVLPEAQFPSREDVLVTSCCSDPDRCRTGDLFVAQVTAEGDGHNWADEAVARGAMAIVAERLLPVNVPVIVVDDTREALGRICQAMAGRPSEQMVTIGVTGSSGKTVVSLLIASIFEAAGRTVGVTSSIGYSDSLDQSPARVTTPRAPVLANWMGRMAAAGCTHSVIEVSSRALAERRVAGIGFDAAVLTNLTRAHLSLHGSPENYKAAKRRLLTLLKPGGVAILNADDHGSREFLMSLDVPCLTFGLHGEAEVTATVIERHRSEQTFLLMAGSETIPVRTFMIGDAHISNCLAATAVALTLGIDLQTIVRGLEAVSHVPGRLERIECGQPFGVFIDSARTPEALAQSLKTLRQVSSGGRVICVFGAAGERDRDARPMLGRVAERGCDLPIITSDNPRNEEPLEIAHQIIDGFQDAAKAHVLPNRAAAIRYALSIARPGDCVLITGKGDRTEQIIGARRTRHDDRDLACRHLYEQATETPQLRIYRG